ncbi:DUF4855 domain-containing protein [Brevibacillus fluminis]|uniref:DUF4855 domain-containing protein n=1 Tax=Brevibacillus fluminis TaxID=511487 RepID=A0A3M8D9B2_9BACL|nr:DUF4855 domain-containing protein [Brevibacillus fluminis]RNB84606.1 DUF4855 domain-containing protein [Brevibacillus fluminis]
MSPYPNLACSCVNQLFLAYTGYSIGSDSIPQYQFWEPSDLLPVIAHLDRQTGTINGSMFTDVLFLAFAVLNEQGEPRYLTRNEQAPATVADWTIYTDELFLCTRNLDALRIAHEKTCFAEWTRVWVALPYPNPSVVGDDANRIRAIIRWMDDFLARWDTASLDCQLRLMGFYWVQESVYFTGPANDDRSVIRAVNRAIRARCAAGSLLHSLWIPYQQANGWDQWRKLGFSLSFLQPNHYFQPTQLIETAAVQSYANGLGVEIEFDLGVTYDAAKRARLQEYLRLGATGGTDPAGNVFGPYMRTSPLAWYSGGWFFGKNGRKQAFVSLYQSDGPLYDQIYWYLHGIYEPQTD